MKRKVFTALGALLILTLLFASGFSVYEGFSVEGFESAESSQNYVPGEVIVRYNDDLIDTKTSFGLQSVQTFASSVAIEEKKRIGDGKMSVFEIKDGKSVERKIEELEKDPRVKYAEPNYIYSLQNTPPNDALWGDLWGLEKIDILDAWGISEGEKETIIVAVIDDGVAYSHPDLINNMWDGTACVNENGEDLGGSDRKVVWISFTIPKIDFRNSMTILEV